MIKRMGLLLFLLSLGSCGSMTPTMAFSGATPAPVCQDGHPDTNPPEVAKWFREIHNRESGSCCAEGDGYPAAIDEEAEPGHPGHGHIIDPSEKEIWSKGCLIKTRPALAPPYDFTFSYEKTVHEKYGNPTKTALVFGGSTWDAGAKMPHLMTPPYCVVMLPPSF